MLFSTVDEIKEYLPVSVSFEFNDIKPFIKQAEDNFIIPAISQEQYDALITALSGTPTPAETELIDLVRAPLAAYAYLYYIPWGQVQISGAGIQIASTDQMKTAFQWQIDDLEGSARKAGYYGIDKVLEFLDGKESIYAAWSGSSAYTDFKSFYVFSTRTLNDIYPLIGNSRQNFIKLMPSMLRMEEFKIIPLISDDFNTELKAKVKAGSASAQEKKAIKYIQHSIAFLAVADALSELSVEIDERGILMFNNTGGSATLKTKQPATDTIISKLESRAAANGETYLSMLESLLLEDPDSFPTFKSSTAYTDNSTDFTQNDDGQGYFSAL